MPSSLGLTGQDLAFLAFETPTLPMHVGAITQFAVADRQRGNDGEPDPALLCADLCERLRAVPALGQRLERRGRAQQRAWSEPAPWVPAEHVSSLRLPPPGSRDQLEALASSFLARPLDRARPLWEVRVVTGLAGGAHFAVLWKLHHALLDGRAGVALLRMLLPGQPALPATAGGPRIRPRSVRRGTWRSLLAFARRVWPPLAPSALNGSVSRARHLRTIAFDLAPLEEIRRRHGGTLNDVLLALVASALERRLGGGRPGPSTRPRIRAFCPVDLRGAGDPEQLGNRLGALLVDLPRESDPLAALAGIAGRTRAAKRSGQAGGMDFLGRLSARLPGWLPRTLMGLAGRLRLYNLVVTHVRLPAERLALGGAPLVALDAFPPLFARQRLAIAAVRDARSLRVGLTSAWPDAREVEAVAEALREAAADLGASLRGTPAPACAA